VAGFMTRPGRLAQRTRDLLERLGIDLDPDAPVGTLSVAQQQMVEIAKALSYDAKVLILDEPTAALNEREAETLHQLIERFVTPTTGVVYISHRMEELRRIADRVQVIRDGELIDTMDMADATLEDVITKMVGRSIDTGAGPEGVRTDRPTVLEAHDLHSAPLVRGASFDLREGEILGIAGLMGAGRTETMRALIGSLPLQQGAVTYRGRPARFRSPADAARHGIGYLSEDRKQLGLMLSRSVKSNMEISSLSDQFRRWGFVRDRAARQAAEEQTRALQVKTPGVDQITKNLSGGNQQKVVLGRWLIKDCDVLIVDEPTRGIDVGAKEEIYQLLNRLAAQGKSIIMISSDLPEVLRMAHRIVVMSQGRVTGVLDATEADQESVMELATDGARQHRPPGTTRPGMPHEHAEPTSAAHDEGAS
jgi:ribose transport system ATP-binding protein